MKPELLFLAHRIPYPPNRGDKMRSWHLLRHLGQFATVHLGAFADDAADAAHLDALREAMGGSLGEAYIEPRHRSKLWPLRALLRNQPAALAAFHGSGRMNDFAAEMLARPRLAGVFAFSIQMAQFVPAGYARPFVMDFVDFDSAKFADYAAASTGLRKLAYLRETWRLRAYEKRVAERATLSLFVSEAEAALFRETARPKGADIRALGNGIDLEAYDPDAAFAPLVDPPRAPLIVFTGQMDYRPNIEAVRAFAVDVMPTIRKLYDARFAIVGRRPDPSVLALDGQDGVIVTGEVPDVRPWLAAASVVVAPLRIARGIQNKVLEAMAMGRPVVASSGAFEGIDAVPGRDLVVADSPDEQFDAVLSLWEEPERAEAMGKAARARMVERYTWDAQLAPLAAMLGLDARKAAA